MDIERFTLGLILTFGSIGGIVFTIWANEIHERKMRRNKQ
jgi:hypothetical protein